MARTVYNAEKQLSTWLRRPKPRIAASIATSFIFGIVLAFLLPQRFTEDIVVDKFARLAAPVISAFYQPASRNEITVVLIDQNSVGSRRWPLGYEYYSDLLRKISLRSPKAIFLDIVLVHGADSGLDRLKKTIAALSKETTDRRPVKIFLAALRSDEGLSISPDFDSLPEEQATKVAVEYEPAGVDHLAWTYPLHYRVVGPAAGQARGAPDRRTKAIAADVPSAAFAIYRALYGKPRNGAGDGTAVPWSIALTWGLTPSRSGPRGWIYNPTQEEENELEERHGIGKTILRRFAYWFGLTETREPGEGGGDTGTYCSSMGETRTALLVWRAEVRALFPSAGMPLCAYHRTVIAGEMDDMEGAERREAFTDKIVMIGTALDDGGDFIVSPLHERLPGVYLHAMALDNLMTWNGSYVENREPALGWSHDKLLLEWVAIFGMVGVSLLHLLKKFWKPGFRRMIEGHVHDCVTSRRPLRVRPAPASAVRKTALRRARRHAVAQERLDGVRTVLRRRGGGPPSIWRRMAFAASWKLLTGCVAICLTLALLLLGQKIFHESYLAVTHVVACAITAEWFEWGEKFVDFFTGHEESE
ncbi:CHASE2 domain-containing protein [Paraburkholderia lycopersici]|uniref:CHASE2 domain-containing protein n=1 Tax=Paraburkholderia lycopersici TaxID=416944 RepID=A0A1G6GJD8_9BURK|nr:CHASE2 domain-containing protein [Paraburkholderia lycopersici]